MKTRTSFTVDSHLLRELGERLVGQHHIALAELIKNSYDADATRVVITFSEDSIEVVDDGHGMSYADFDQRWLRIGTTHKVARATSPRYGRPMTGSKGVGRLAVQLLASKMELSSVACDAPREEVRAEVDWNEAAKAGLLTEAPVDLETGSPTVPFPEGSPCGTRIVLRELLDEWDSDAFTELAQEVWPLQPPFPGGRQGRGEGFRVELRSPHDAVVEAFQRQMSAILDIWTARLVGRLQPADGEPRDDEYEVVRPSKDGLDDEYVAEEFVDHDPAGRWPDRSIRLSLEIGGEQRSVGYRLPNCHLENLEFEIRVFTLKYRQPHGISVGEARRYLNRFGGVHVYDAGFHLPYYGAEQDWLRIEMDHSHRVSTSKLLPKALQATNGQRFLPTNSRLFGAVYVDTGEEQRAARRGASGTERDALAIQVTRDRLTVNAAYRDVVAIVRWALDYYAHVEAGRSYGERLSAGNAKPQPDQAIERIRAVVEKHEHMLPEEASEELRREVNNAADAMKGTAARDEARFGLLGALATAGVAAVALEHESARERRTLRSVADRLHALGDEYRLDELRDLASRVRASLERSAALRKVFAPLLDDESKERGARRFRAAALVTDVVDRTRAIARGVDFTVGDIAGQILLPQGTHAEWSSLLQNLLVNAANATLDAPERRVLIEARVERAERRLLISDTGVGIDLDRAEELFEPFTRALQISRDRRGLVIGGNGLGLTIVRMLADGLRCHVHFIRPEPGFATTAELKWEEGT